MWIWGGHILLTELDGVAKQVLEQLHQLGAVCHDGGQVIRRYNRPGFADAAPQVAKGLVEGVLHVGQLPLDALRSTLE